MDWTTILLALPLSLTGVISSEQWRNLVTDPAPHAVTNLLGGTATLDSIADGYLRLHPTTGSLLEARLQSDSTIDVILSVDVLGTRDSQHRRYDCSWQKLPVDRRPDASHFYCANDSIDADTFGQLLQPLLISMEFDADGQIAYSIDPEKYLPKETYQRIRPGIK